MVCVLYLVTKFCVHLLVKIIAVLIALVHRCANTHYTYIPLSTTAIHIILMRCDSVGQSMDYRIFKRLSININCVYNCGLFHNVTRTRVCVCLQMKRCTNGHGYLAINILFALHHKCREMLHDVLYTYCFICIVASIRVIYVSSYTQFCSSSVHGVCVCVRMSAEISSSCPVFVVRLHCSCVIGQFEMNVITIPQTIEI